MSSSPKVLLVDDRTDNLLTLEAQLRAQRAEFLKATSGNQALDLLLLHEIALALVDVQMPEMDGFELAELMRGSKRTRDIPIIFVTAGLHDRARVFKGYESGAVDFLAKPIEPQLLSNKVAVFLQLYEQKRQLAERVQQLEAAVAERKRAEEELTDRAVELEAVLDSLQDAVFVYDGAGRAIRVNPAAQELYGIDVRQVGVEAAAERNLNFRRTDGTPMPAFELPFRRALRGERVIREEYLFTGADGSDRVGEATATPLFLNDNRIVGAVAIARDITDQKQAEEALRASEHFNKSVLESSWDCIKTLDLQGNLLSINEAGLELLEISDPAPLLHTSWVSLWREEDRAQVSDALAVAARGGAGRFQAFCPSALGKPRWWDVQVTPILDSRGNVQRLLATSREISELRGALDAVRRSEARLGLLSRTAGRLLAADDPQAAVNELCHEVMEHIDCQTFFNYLVISDKKEKLHLNAYAGVSEEAARALEFLDFGAELCGCVAQSGRRLIVEDVLRSSDPRVALIRSVGIQAYCCHPLMGEGRVIGTLAFATKSRPYFSEDELELMRTVADQVSTALQRVLGRRALTAANAELLEADRRKNEFMATLSHELRNPLAPIKNSLYILERAPGGDQARRAKAVIDRQVNQLARLVDDLLDVTRITRNKIQLQRQRLEFNELIRRTIDDHRAEFEKAGVQLEMQPATSPLWLDADWNRLAQAVGNLLQNAVKFTPMNGRVTVIVSHDTSRTQALLRVVDTGVGMKPEMLARLFQPFTQADTSLDRSKGGLGLGLALVRGLVELHGGAIDARSAGLGQGSEFTIRLPLDAASPQIAERALLRIDESTSCRVLIIEDNSDAAESLREALELDGHTVVVANNGPDGVSTALECRPDIILCDIGLPTMDGYEVARRCRAESSLSGIYLVALSGYALPEDVQRAHDAGFDRHMSKPPRLDQLNALFSALRGSAHRRPLQAAEEAGDAAPAREPTLR